jgi:hypothetical protein
LAASQGVTPQEPYTSSRFPALLVARAKADRRAVVRFAKAFFVALLVAFGGALAAVSTLGLRILDIHDSGWILHGSLGPDPAAYWLAWRYFVNAPWAMPLGLNPGYGLELSSSIFYVDAVPLAAIMAKALRPILEISQYWGPWLVLSAGLQAFLAWRLLGLHVRDPWIRGLGALLFVWQPLLLNRMGGHFALVAQWALLWSLFLCLRPTALRQGLHWALCLGTVAMLNPYVLTMCFALWVADLGARILRGMNKAAAAVQLVLVPSTCALGLWLAGYFCLSGKVEPIGLRYGQAQLDLTAPFDGVEWGRFLPQVPGLRHWEHGGSYLGAGVLMLLAIALWLSLRGGLGPVLKRHGLLIAALLAMLCFAVSPNLAIGGHVVTLFELPEFFERLADMLRSSERFFWPLAYASILGALVLIATRLPAPAARLVVAGAVALQLADIEVGMARFRALVAEAPPVAADRLRSSFWDDAALRYSRVRAVPASNFGPHWEEVARFAAESGLPTDAVYLSRVDPGVMQAVNARILADLRAGKWERGTLYILRNSSVRGLVARRASPSRDLLAEMDGIAVFAPAWHAR